MSDWQLIETAPKDGTKILTFCPGNPRAEWPVNRKDRIAVNEWRGTTWYRTSSEAPPTHWMPLPPYPGAEK